jgi:2-isopropylmalate synthase
MSKRIYLYDSTLRDGAQTSTVNFTVQNKIDFSLALDQLGVDYIEGGWPGANPTDDNFFAKLPSLQNSQFVAFGMTKKNGVSAENDPNLNALTNSSAFAVCVVGKSWDFHLTYALNITQKENEQMILQSLQHIIAKKKIAMFDAEHFFDGYKSNPVFALQILKTAYQANPRWIILCDTNGGTLPSEIKTIVSEVTKHIPGSQLGIHCHNDTGNAVANSIVAVEAGVCQVQGTINGLGERCGNANLTSLIPTLSIKMGYDLGKINLKKLVKTSRLLDDILNKTSDDFAPYVGKFAFAHKGGLHVSAVNKNPQSYEHINPDLVGNQRQILVSDQAGRSNIISRLQSFGFNQNYPVEKLNQLVNLVKQQESIGYSYDTADASFALLAYNFLQKSPTFFELINFQVIDQKMAIAGNKFATHSEARIKIKIGNKTLLTIAEGNGPVNSLDKALRKALLRKYPSLKNTTLIDYKVRILNSNSGTKAITRVQIQFQNNSNIWTTIGVAENILDASFLALQDGIFYQLLREENHFDIFR